MATRDRSRRPGAGAVDYHSLANKLQIKGDSPPPARRRQALATKQPAKPAAKPAARQAAEQPTKQAAKQAVHPAKRAHTAGGKENAAAQRHAGGRSTCAAVAPADDEEGPLSEDEGEPVAESSLDSDGNSLGEPRGATDDTEKGESIRP
eukprot:scaffold25.g5140.t1